MGRRKRNPKRIFVTEKICERKIAEKLNSDEKEAIEEQKRKNLFINEIAINVYSRLKLPLVYPMQDGSLDDSDEEDTVELNFWPRFVFVSNLCLICMERSEKTCESCGMVSYCTVRHMQQDRPKHHDLCKVLTEVCQIEGGLSLLSELNADDYRVYRLKLIEIVQCRLDRPLQLWEKEILLYPRVCCSCRRFSTTLKCCPACGIGLFCENHDGGHEEWCREFQVFRRMLFMQHKNGHIEPEIPDTFQKEPLHLLDNFDLLIAQLFGRSTYYFNMDCYTYCSLSHISSIPLTALYSMQISCQNWKTIDTFVVHVIGAEFQYECINLHVWEKLFLHLLPNLKHLKLMFVGPELSLPTVPLDLLTAVKICSSCKSFGRRVKISFHPKKLYHDFCRSKQFIEPHLVCLFNPGLYRETGFKGKDTWPETIREFCKMKIPVCVTSYTKQEIPREIIRIKSIADVETILEPQKNPFASIKPDRNFVSDDTVPLIYKNYYLIIVKGKL
ncbi:MSS51 protein, partial [Pseudoatta argentina]